MNETTAETIKESKLPDDLPRFAQQGHEHPREYREFYVEAARFEGARGRATSEEQAIASYEQFMDIHPPGSADCTVQEIIED